MIVRAIYLDSSAIVRLVDEEPESAALRAFLRGRRDLISSALARTEVTRALTPLGALAVQRARDLMGKRIELLRINDAILNDAGEMGPIQLRTLDAIHLATARQLGADLHRVVTYDARMASAARSLGLKAISPAEES